MISKYYYCFQILFLLIIIIVSSCGTGSNHSENLNHNVQNDSNEALKEEVIAIHDEVMPKMGALRAHQKRLAEEAAELEAKDGSRYQEEIKKRRQIAQDLDEAYEGMFVWMRQFRPQLDEMDEDEGRAYLLEQKEKVRKVNEEIKSALARAEETTMGDVSQ